MKESLTNRIHSGIEKRANNAAATVRKYRRGRLRRSQVLRMRQKKPRAEINFSSFRIIPEALRNYGKGSETFLRKWQNFGRLKKEITTPFSFSGHHFNPADEGSWHGFSIPPPPPAPQ